MKERVFYKPLRLILEEERLNAKGLKEIFPGELHDLIDSYFDGKPLDHEEEINLEYNIRIKLADGSYSPDDLSRLIFEMQRIGEFTDLGGWIRDAFIKGLIDKGEFVKKALPAFLAGDFHIYTDFYIQAEHGLIKELLAKNNKVSVQDIDTFILNYSLAPTDEEKTEFLRQKLRKLGLAGDYLNGTIKSLREEEKLLEQILTEKYFYLEGKGFLTDSSKALMIGLVKKTEEKRELPSSTGSRPKLPYESYFAVRDSGEKF